MSTAPTLQESGDTLGADRLRSMALHSLSAMAAGGMCDQLGGGFHRYSVDELWWVCSCSNCQVDEARVRFTGISDRPVHSVPQCT